MEKAYIYPLPKDPTPPKGYTFNSARGFWVSDDNSQPMVMMKNPPAPQTKKCDVETGEDRKGE